MKKNFKRIAAAVLASVLVFTFAVSSFAAYYGDVNADSKVNSTDALLVLQYAVGKDTDIDEKTADVNNDGQINSTDALLILQISVGKNEPVEVPTAAPSSKGEVIALYNNAINKVVDEKAGYTKQRTTTIQEMEGGALLKIQLVVDMINNFLGVGTTEFVNRKGRSELLLKSTLTADDVTSASCTKTGSNYTVTLTLKDGSSSATAKKVTDNSALAKCGLLTGKVADSRHDYLSSGSVYGSMGDVKNVSVDKIEAANSNIQIVSVIGTDGKMVSLMASFDWTVEMENVKYSMVSVKKANGKAHTAVVISDFEW